MRPTPTNEERCEALTASGARCKGFKARGRSVCGAHRLREVRVASPTARYVRPDVLEVAAWIHIDPEPCPACGSTEDPPRHGLGLFQPTEVVPLCRPCVEEWSRDARLIAVQAHYLARWERLAESLTEQEAFDLMAVLHGGDIETLTERADDLEEVSTDDAT
ncbi:MAG: hypothetical protein JJT89_06580 [Nitriliruptoraceae bacterium]|nr:hypothetical protein [Nitriliruptoraceae bacterium]